MKNIFQKLSLPAWLQLSNLETWWSEHNSRWPKYVPLLVASFMLMVIVIGFFVPKIISIVSLVVAMLAAPATLSEKTPVRQSLAKIRWLGRINIDDFFALLIIGFMYLVMVISTLHSYIVMVSYSFIIIHQITMQSLNLFVIYATYYYYSNRKDEKKKNLSTIKKILQVFIVTQILVFSLGFFAQKYIEFGFLDRAFEEAKTFKQFNALMWGSSSPNESVYINVLSHRYFLDFAKLRQTNRFDESFDVQLWEVFSWENTVYTITPSCLYKYVNSAKLSEKEIKNLKSKVGISFYGYEELAEQLSWSHYHPNQTPFLECTISSRTKKDEYQFKQSWNEFLFLTSDYLSPENIKSRKSTLDTLFKINFSISRLFAWSTTVITNNILRPQLTYISSLEVFFTTLNLRFLLAIKENGSVIMAVLGTIFALLTIYLLSSIVEVYNGYYDHEHNKTKTLFFTMLALASIALAIIAW